MWQIKDGNGLYLADCSPDWDEDGVKCSQQLELLLLGSCVEDTDDGPFGKQRRYAWGLVVYSGPETVGVEGVAYYSVGAFYSKPKGRGGLTLFEKCEERAICLI